MSISRSNAQGQWRRVCKKYPCALCGHPDWCLVAADGTAAICPRTPSDRRAGEAGFLHVLVDHETRWKPKQRLVIAIDNERIDHSKAAQRFQSCAERRIRIEELADQLGVSRRSLDRLSVGWSAGHHAWTFPLFDHTANTVLGINRRFRNGDKRVIAGHKIGLYLPRDLPSDLSEETLLVCEGGSDTAAGLDLGFWAVGRFSCNTCLSHLRQLVVQRKPKLTVICADAGNEIEARGAKALAHALLPYAQELKLIAPPHPLKDIRAWMCAGATSESLKQVIDSAQLQRLRIRIV